MSIEWCYGPHMPPRREDLLVSLHPVTKALRRIEDVAAAQHGVSMWQYAILSVVDDTPELNQGEVAKRLQYSVNRIIGDLDVLEQRRLLTRRPGPDRRANLLRVTAAGSALRQRIRTEIRAGEDELLTGLTSAQRNDFRAALRHLLQQVRAAES